MIKVNVGFAPPHAPSMANMYFAAMKFTVDGQQYGCVFWFYCKPLKRQVRQATKLFKQMISEAVLTERHQKGVQESE